MTITGSYTMLLLVCWREE